MGHVMFATRLAISGTILFLVSIGAVVYLVTSLTFKNLPATVATVVVSVVAGWAWFYLPLIQFGASASEE